MKNIYLIVGPSGVGKTTLAERLHDWYGLNPVESYTTRPARYPNESGHIFVTKDEFENLDKVMAYVMYNGYEYGVTEALLDRCDTYVIEPSGVKDILTNYRGNKGIAIISLTANQEVLAERMRKRGDKEATILARITEDKKLFCDTKFCSLGVPFLEINTGDLNTNVHKAKAFINELEDNDFDVTIYQIVPERDPNHLLFANSTAVQRIHKGNTINLSIYDEVWSGNMPVTSLEDIFCRFNSDKRPMADCLRSLSVSDIVEIRHNQNHELNGIWFCDSFGWKRIEHGRFVFA